MSNSSEDNYSDEGTGNSRNASLIRRLRQQHNVGSNELEGEFSEDYQSNDSDHNPPCDEDQKDFQLNEQRVNKGKYIKTSRYGNKSEFFDSDSSGPVDILESHDQDSWELRKKDRQISSFDTDNRLENHNNKRSKKYNHDIMDTYEDRKMGNLSNSNESLTVEGDWAVALGNMADSKTRRPESRTEVDHDQIRRDASPGRRRRETRQRPNVIVTDVDVHVDNNEYMRKEMENDEYRQRRRKEKSDSHLNIPHRSEQETFESLKRSRARSEPRKAIKQGKDEVNRAEKHVHMIDFERKTQDELDARKTERDPHNSREIRDGNDAEMWERDGNFEYQERVAVHERNKSQPERRKSQNQSKQNESITRSGNCSNRNEFERTQNNDKSENSRRGPNETQKRQNSLEHKAKTCDREPVENINRGNNSCKKEFSHTKTCSFEDERDEKQHGHHDRKREQKSDDNEPNTRYYTPQLERRQNRRKRGPLLSLVSEDDLSNSNFISRGFEKSRNEITAFTPAGKIKVRHDHKKTRGPSTEDEFSMPRNKMGSFQDFRPISKERSVSRISNINGKFLFIFFNSSFLLCNLYKFSIWKHLQFFF